MKRTVICLLMVQKLLTLKQKILKLQQLVQETFQKTGKQIIYKKTGFNGYVLDLSVDYDAIAVDDMADIRKYLIKNRTQYNKNV